jgi:hypothetical protein
MDKDYVWGVAPRKEPGWLGRTTLAYGGWMLEGKFLAWAPVVLAIMVFAVNTGAELGWWGEPLRGAWQNEEVARHNVGVGEGVLRVWEAKEPPWTVPAPKKKPKTKQKGAADSGEADVLTHDVWERERASIESKIAVYRPGVPAWWWPLGGEQPEAWTQYHRYGWGLVYHANHFLEHTPYGFLGLVAMLGSAGWAALERRRRNRQEAERLERRRKDDAEREVYERRQKKEQQEWDARQAELARQKRERLAALERERVGVVRSERVTEPSAEPPTESQRRAPVVEDAPTDRDVLVRSDDVVGDELAADATLRDVRHLPANDRKPVKKKRPANQVRRPKRKSPE